MSQRQAVRRTRQRGAQAGMTLIELMIAMVVLVVGMLGALVMVTTAISTNNRNKLDTTGTMMAQFVLEQIAAQPATLSTVLLVTDCDGTDHQINGTAAAGPAGAGAALLEKDSSPYLAGDIDWSQDFASVTSGYGMQFVTCDDNDISTTYEVRWNVLSVSAFTKLVTVSARMRTSTSASPFFAPPVTLRTISGQ